MAENNSTPAPADNGKTVAIVAYVCIIIAFFMHNGNKTKLGAYHMRQALGLCILAIVGAIALTIVSIICAFIPVVGWILSLVLSLAYLVGFMYLWIMGILNALKCEEKPLPFVGKKFEEKLGKLFA